MYLTNESRENFARVMASHVLPGVFPVLMADRDDAIGTGQLLKVGGRRLLLTAGHNLGAGSTGHDVAVVLDSKQLRTSAYWLRGHRRQVWTETAQIGEGAAGRERPIDVGVVEILADEDPLHALPAMDIDFLRAGPLPEGTAVVVVGFPYELTWGDHPSDPPTAARPMTVATGVIPANEWPRDDVDHKTHHVLLWGNGKKEALEDDAARTVDRVPYPGGLSGAGVWTLERGQMGDRVQLVGVQTGLHNETQTLIAVNGNVVASLVAHLIPEVRDGLTARGFDLSS